MKIFVEHDDRGDIKSVGFSAEQSTKKTSLRPRPGYAVSEVDAPSVRDAQDQEHLREIRLHFRVEGRAHAARLIRK